MPLFLVFLLISSIACIFLSFFPALNFLGGLIWGVSIIMAGLYLNARKILLIFVFNLIILYVLSGATNTLFLIFFGGLSALVMSQMLVNEKKYYDILKIGMITAFLGVSVFLGLIFINTGEIGSEETKIQLEQYLTESLDRYEEAGLTAYPEETGLSREELEEQFAQMASIFSRLLPAIFYLEAFLLVFTMMFFASFLERKREIRRLKKKEFSQEFMPWQLAWIVIAGLALFLLGKDELATIYYLGSNILLVMTPILCYFGLSTLWYKVRQFSRGSKIAMLVGMIILFIFLSVAMIVLLALIGLFDSLLDFRKIRVQKEE